MMLEAFIQSIEGFVPFILYFLMSIFLVAVFISIYIWITPHREFELIAANNSAASLAFGGALLGFALPLSSAISHSLSFLDCAIWSLIALVVQLITFFMLRFMIKQLSERITRGEVATGILIATCSISIGLINAACMSY